MIVAANCIRHNAKIVKKFLHRDVWEAVPYGNVVIIPTLNYKSLKNVCRKSGKISLHAFSLCSFSNKITSFIISYE